MPFHTAGYYSSVATGTSSYTDLAAVEDGVMVTRNTHLVFGQSMRLFAACAIGSSLVNARLSTPSLRRVAKRHIRPINDAAAMPTDPNLANMIEQPMEIPATEEIAVEAYHSSGSSQGVFTFLWLATNLDPPPKGDIIPIRATATTNSSSNVWTELSLTWDQQLPRGMYSVVGSEHISTNALAHRWILDGTPFRPGSLSQTTVAKRTHPLFLSGKLGSWGTFGSPVMPRIQAITASGDTSHVVYLHVVRLG